MSCDSLTVYALELLEERIMSAIAEKLAPIHEAIDQLDEAIVEVQNELEDLKDQVEAEVPTVEEMGELDDVFDRIVAAKDALRPPPPVEPATETPPAV